MRLAALVPAGFLAGAVLCRIWLHSAPQAVATDLAQPLAVVTYWQVFGAKMWLALFLAVAIASVGYIGALRAPFGTRAVVLFSCAACAAALAFPVVFSSDVYAYAGYGDMALHGIDPYAHARITLRDPLLDAVQWQWGNPPPMCVYGPAFVWIARAIVGMLLPLGAAAPLWGFRILACGALVACAPLTAAAFARAPRNVRLAASAGVALNPLAVWASAEGHNDALVLAAVLAGFALLQRFRPFAGAVAIALAALIKAPAIAAAFFVSLYSWRDKPRFTQIALGAALGTAIVAAIAVPLEYGVHAHLAPGGRYFPQFSVQALLAYVIPVRLAAGIVFGICGLLGIEGARRLSAGDARGALLLALALWIALPNPYPWYAVWIVPVAFLAWGTRAAWSIIGISLAGVLRYFGDATSDVVPALTAVIVLAQFGLPPAAVSAARTFARRRGRRETRTPALGFARRRFP